MSIIEIFHEIKLRPSLYMPSKTLDNIEVFINGYKAANNSSEDVSLVDNFLMLFLKKHNYSSVGYSWKDVVLSYDCDSEPFENFFELWQKFIESTDDNSKIDYSSHSWELSMCDLVHAIESRPLLYVRDKTFTSLLDFIEGFQACLFSYRIDGFDVYPDFKNNWVPSKIANDDYTTMEAFFLHGRSESVAYEEFFKYWKEYEKTL